MKKRRKKDSFKAMLSVFGKKGGRKKSRLNYMSAPKIGKEYKGMIEIVDRETGGFAIKYGGDPKRILTRSKIKVWLGNNSFNCGKYLRNTDTILLVEFYPSTFRDKIQRLQALIHETNHFKSRNELKGQDLCFGVGLTHCLKIGRKRIYRGLILFNEAITEEIAQMLLSSIVPKYPDLFGGEWNYWGCVSAYKEERLILNTMQRKIAQYLGLSLERVKEAFYRAYYTSSFEEISRLIDLAFGRESFLSLLEIKSINDLDKYLKETYQKIDPIALS